MDLYTFKVDRFHIYHTRSFHKDTLHLSYAAFVNGDVVRQKTIDLNDDLNDGEYNPDDYTPGRPRRRPASRTS
jgi:hypothetical protein